MTSYYFDETERLVANPHKGVGTRAQELYDTYCEKYGWDKTKRGLFGLRQILYAERATPEGYSPWFLPHSNLSNTKGGNWTNIISNNMVYETWMEEQYGLYQDETIRVTFAKRKSGEYVFLGIYKPIKVEKKEVSEIIKNRNSEIIKQKGDTVWVKHYKRISMYYPSTRLLNIK